MTDNALPIFSFGILADPQYAACKPDEAMNRYFASSLAKVTDAIAVFNRHELAFVVTLGDLIDGGSKNFADILPLYERLRHRSLLLPGNHDFAITAKQLADVYGLLNMPAPYHDFAMGGMRFIVLDGSDISLFAPPLNDPRRAIATERLTELKATGAINAQTWNGSLSDTQFAWLTQTLDAAQAAGERVVIFCHYPVFPANEHNLWDAPDILALLKRYSCFAAWFCGHNHAGNFGEIDGQYFVNFKGIVDTPDENTFAIADIYADRIDIRGFGREDSRSLPLK
jgi:predicted phosphodiesterase